MFYEPQVHWRPPYRRLPAHTHTCALARWCPVRSPVPSSSANLTTPAGPPARLTATARAAAGRPTATRSGCRRAPRSTRSVKAQSDAPCKAVPPRHGPLNPRQPHLHLHPHPRPPLQRRRRDQCRSSPSGTTASLTPHALPTSSEGMSVLPPRRPCDIPPRHICSRTSSRHAYAHRCFFFGWCRQTADGARSAPNTVRPSAYVCLPCVGWARPRLTLAEKILQMSRGGAAANTPAPGIERLGIAPHVWGTECATGLGSDDASFAGTSFPQPLGQAATWDKDLVHRVAVATHVEIRAQHNEDMRNGLVKCARADAMRWRPAQRTAVPLRFHLPRVQPLLLCCSAASACRAVPLRQCFARTHFDMNPTPLPQQRWFARPHVVVINPTFPQQRRAGQLTNQPRTLCTLEGTIMASTAGAPSSTSCATGPGAATTKRTYARKGAPAKTLVEKPPLCLSLLLRRMHVPWDVTSATQLASS